MNKKLSPRVEYLKFLGQDEEIVLGQDEEIVRHDAW